MGPFRCYTDRDKGSGKQVRLLEVMGPSQGICLSDLIGVYEGTMMFGNASRAKCPSDTGEPEEMETRRKFNKFCTRAKDGAEPQHFLSFDNFVSLLAHYEAASPSAVSSYFYAVDRTLAHTPTAFFALSLVL